MSPPSLDSAIRRTLISGPKGAATVIARRTAAPSLSALGNTMGGASIALMMLRTMNGRERLSWIAWSWALTLLSFVRVRLNRRKLRLVGRHLKKREGLPLVDVAAIEAAS